ncbi:MAG: hypothetical protein OHK0017_08920 [Patescibacteria group bacterium]
MLSHSSRQKISWLLYFGGSVLTVATSVCFATATPAYAGRCIAVYSAEQYAQMAQNDAESLTLANESTALSEEYRQIMQDTSGNQNERSREITERRAAIVQEQQNLDQSTQDIINAPTGYVDETTGGSC